MANILKPLIIQGDRSILLDVHTPEASEARFALIPFAELEKSPEHLHTYRLTGLSLWNAASAGFTAEKIIATLKYFSRFDIPPAVIGWIEETFTRYGKITLLPFEDSNFLCLHTEDDRIYQELKSSAKLTKYLLTSELPRTFLIALLNRGTVKQVLLKMGWPVRDMVPLKDGAPLDIQLRTMTKKEKDFIIRDYQREAAAAFTGNRGPGTGFGTIVLPCGAGKTIVGMLVMSLLNTDTLILTTNTAAVHQWKRELLDKTELEPDTIGIYSGETKEIKPVTVATYQILTWRPDTESEFPHFQIFRERNWGLIIYDEVHLLPAPVFRITAELQVVRRLGLTATLVREDGCEGDVFSLVGPKRYDVPWKEMEEKGWIARAYCTEIRIPLPVSKEIEYAAAPLREKHRIASENEAKNETVKRLLVKHADDQVLIIGQYIAQLKKIAEAVNAPLITGKTSNAEREILYESFRTGKISVLVVSKVANFAIDLPDASVAIQISGTFGSRQEEAQRLGRILRPKERNSFFYTLVTRHSVEEECADHRQKFLAEQGYAYSLITGADIDSVPLLPEP
ncbi:MAG: DEAD/DEAH box helicase [Treponema sp.]